MPVSLTRLDLSGLGMGYINLQLKEHRSRTSEWNLRESNLPLERGWKWGTLLTQGIRPMQRPGIKQMETILTDPAGHSNWMTMMGACRFHKNCETPRFLTTSSPARIPKYEGKGDPAKHLNNHKTQMSLRGALPTLKCKAFHLTLTRAAEIGYIRIFAGSIRSWPNLKKAFLNQYLSSKEGEAPIQRLQDIRQQAEETLKSYLARFTDEMTYCEQFTNR